MNVYLNNQYDPTNIVMFTNVPNIVDVVDEMSGGTQTIITIDILGSFYNITTADSQYNITLFGESIGNVMAAKEAVNKNFIVMQTMENTAQSIARALRNCGNLYAMFTIMVNGSSITLKSRVNGNVLTEDFFTTNIPSEYISVTSEQGTTESLLNDALIDVDLLDSNGEIITRLEKTFIDGKTSFNISPILTSIAEKERAIPVNINITSYKDGVTSFLSYIGGNHTSIGYLCNQGSKYIERNGVVFAQNVSRGSDTNAEYINNMPLYVYGTTIPLSFYTANNTGGMTIKVEYLDNAYNVIGTDTTTWRNTDSSEVLKQYTVDMNQRYFSSAFYVDVSLGSTKIRYTVLKPLKSSSENVRIQWINEYGGVSFFDFNASHTQDKKVSQETYRRNIFDFYEQDVLELELTYKNNVEYTDTVTSTLLAKDGTYIFNSLAASPYVWTTVNEEKYCILVTDIDVQETDQAGVYKATVKYKYSQQPQSV